QPTLELCQDYKKVAPDTIIILGGPEVSYNSINLLTEHDFIDLVVRGEGEFTLRELLINLNLSKPIYNIPGISYRRGGQVIENPDSPLIKDLDSIPSPYSVEDMKQLYNR